MDIEFKEFKKIPRLSRECIITEKIDGTNGVIHIGENGEFLVGSRSRWITPEDDNYGFAKWALTNKDELMKLGVGTHYGEWWGSGIQRGYDLPKGEKRFSLFNVHRWSDDLIRPKCCSVVPVLWEGIFDTHPINDVLAELCRTGSKASKGFMRPEGVVVFHKAGNLMFKKTIEKDSVPKGSNEIN
jgi:hypothetical protein